MYKCSSLSIRIGTDIVCIPRIAALVDRFGSRFLQKVYTDTEQQAYWKISSKQRLGRETGVTWLAGRWAAKEAVVKALGTGWCGVRYTDVEIRRRADGAPQVCLYRSAEALVANFGTGQWQLSLSHDGDYAIATVIFYQL